MYDTRGEPDWSYLGEHVANRSKRHVGDTDIPLAWVLEAFYDMNATLIDPDYNSKTGESFRVIGYSHSAGFVVTIILVRDSGELYGASAWKANTKDIRLYGGTV
ncbi:MAG: hypothetical protein LBC29_03550 [Propionibacteriaceae bacterium]|jgi:uncharacterized DUF497 family protein|nr:hypothetical protein [Propionibacteriaceae bacterium]